jgi:hypothetical protein
VGRANNPIFRALELAVDLVFPTASQVTAMVEHWRRLSTAIFDPYRPELHYMRGPGPKWREKHDYVGSIDLSSSLSSRTARISNAAFWRPEECDVVS